MRGVDFQPGDTVFARWHGPIEFTIIRKVEIASPMPHWLCKSWGGRKYEYWVFPNIQLSKTKIEVLTGEHNRKQLKLKYLR